MLDVIIVGQGLAGTLLAFQYLKNHKNIVVINKHNEHSSSMVAAGMFNPIMLKNFTRSWNAHILFPYLQEFYPGLEKELGACFYHPIGVVKMFSSFQQQNDWQSKIDHPKYGPFLSDEKVSLPEPLSTPHGAAKVLMSGWVDVAKLIVSFRKTLGEAYIEHPLDHKNDLSVHQTHICLHISGETLNAKKIVFCEGFEGRFNPFFSIPFTPTKGEVMQIKTTFELKHILHQGGFMVPLGEQGLSNIGTTYKKDFANNKPEKEGEQLLEEIAERFTHGQHQKISIRAGIRPNVKNRRPILGTHPIHKNMHVFNGLGSKGVSLGPYFSDRMFEYLECNKELEDEVNYSKLINP